MPFGIKSFAGSNLLFGAEKVKSKLNTKSLTYMKHAAFYHRNTHTVSLLYLVKCLVL